MPTFIPSDSPPGGDWSVTINDPAGDPVVLHGPGARRITSMTGLTGVSAVRRSVRPRPTGHGSIDESRFTDEALISVEAYVRGASDAAVIAELRAVTSACLATLDAPALLKWTENGVGGLSLQRVVKLASAIDPPLGSEAPGLLRYQVQFAASDPRAYSQALSVSQGVALTAVGGGDVFPDVFPDTFAASSGGVVSWVNAGNRPSPPLLRIYGQAVNPQIVQQGTGRRLVLVGEVAVGDYLELDVARRTVRRFTAGSSLPAQGMVNSALSTWFELGPGVNTLTLVADNFDAGAKLDILARAAWT